MAKVGEKWEEGAKKGIDRHYEKGESGGVEGVR